MSNIHTFTRAGVEMSIDVSKLSPTMIDNLIRHGLTQKIGDAAANAKAVATETGVPVADTAKALMEKVRDALLAGEWGVTRDGSGVSEETAIQRKITREVLKAIYGAKTPKWKEFTGETDAKQAEILDKIFADNAEKLSVKVEAEKIRREEVKKSAAKAKEISVEISL